MFITKKRCLFCVKKETTINYNYPNLNKFINEKGKITPSRYTGTCAVHQRKLKKAIKLARNLALLSFTKRERR